MGTGRHSVALARSGFRVFGVDRDAARVLQARVRLSDAGQPSYLWVADLESNSLPEGRFDLVPLYTIPTENIVAATPAGGRFGRIRALRDLHGRAAES